MSNKSVSVYAEALKRKEEEDVKPSPTPEFAAARQENKSNAQPGNKPASPA